MASSVVRGKHVSPLGGSLSRRFSLVLLALLIPIVLVVTSVRRGLLANGEELFAALRIGALAERSRSLVLIQDDVTKELFLDPGAIDLAERKINAYDENAAILAELREVSRWPELSAIVSRMLDVEASIRPLDSRILETLLTGDADEARTLYFDEYREQRREFEELSEALASLSVRLADEAEIQMAERNRATITRAALGLMLGMAVVALLILRLSGGLARRTSGILELLEEVAEGDLRRSLDDASRDELGRIASALSSAIESMRTTLVHVAESLERIGLETRAIHDFSHDVGNAAADQIASIDSVVATVAKATAHIEGLAQGAVTLGDAANRSSAFAEKLRSDGEDLHADGEALREVVEGVSGAVAQLLEGTDHLTGCTNELASASVSTRECSERLVTSFRGIDENAAATERRSREVAQVVERGGENMARTIDRMHAIQKATADSDEAIALLIKRAEEIEEIVDVITTVGARTNLLSLNASILASNAGEYGEGFRVVASEIKALADQVLTNTQEVTDRVAAVQDQAAQVAQAMRASADCVRSGVQVSRETGADFQAIRAAADETRSRMQQVVEAVRNETRSVEQMVDLASALGASGGRIREAVEQQRRGAGIVRDAARGTKEIAQRLRERAALQLEDTRSLTDIVEQVRRSSEQIVAAVRTHRSSHDHTLVTLERVAEEGRQNAASAGSVRDRIAALDDEAERVRERIRWFQVG